MLTQRDKHDFKPEGYSCWQGPRLSGVRGMEAWSGERALLVRLLHPVSCFVIPGYRVLLHSYHRGYRSWCRKVQVIIIMLFLDRASGWLFHCLCHRRSRASDNQYTVPSHHGIVQCAPWLCVVWLRWYLIQLQAVNVISGYLRSCWRGILHSTCMYAVCVRYQEMMW